MVATHDFVGADAEAPSLRSDPEVLDAARRNVEHAPVDLQPAVTDGLEDGEVGHEDVNAGADIMLDDQSSARIIISYLLQVVGELQPDGLERRDPGIEYPPDS